MAEPMPGHEPFAGHLAIPYLTPAGVVKMRFRNLTDEGPKYQDQPGIGPKLYNVGVLVDTPETVVICEGELDTVIMANHVQIPAVGVSGTGAWRDYWWRCFADVPRVLVVFDNDLKEDGSNPGQAAAKKVAKQIRGATIIRPPAGLDVNEWYLQEGAVAIRGALGI